MARLMPFDALKQRVVALEVQPESIAEARFGYSLSYSISLLLTAAG